MALFRYIVTNQSGKKLSGTVEAPNYNVARKELNNLGFSILNLVPTTEKPKAENSKKFIFEALDNNSKFIQGSIPASA